MLSRILAIAAAFALGFIAYMIAMAMTVYDGVLSMIIQPFMGAFFSALFVGVALLVGLLLKIPPLARWWNRTRLWAALLAAASMFVLVFGYSLGLRALMTDEEGRQHILLHPLAALLGYFFMIFAVANWPKRVAR